MKPSEEWNLSTTWIGARTLVYDCVASTNSLAFDLAKDENDGLAILAHEQSSGRGQHGRVWSSPRDTSVLLSVLLFPPPYLMRPVILTAWAAVAVSRVVEKLTNQAPRIKWPNDVLLNEKKICGILIEQKKGTVVGIGLNVLQNERTFQDANLPDATSLTLHCEQDLSWSMVAQLLIEQLDLEYRSLVQQEIGSLEEEWTRYLDLSQKRVQVEHVNGMTTGALSHLSFEMVRLSSGLTFSPEQIVHISPIDHG